MADQKVTELSTLATPASEDLLLVVDNPNGTPASKSCLLYTSPSPRDLSTSRMPSSA